MENDYFVKNNKIYMISIAILIVIIFILGHMYVGIIASLLYGIFALYNIKILKHKKDEWEKFIEDFASRMDISTRNLLINTPFPLTILNGKGNLIWYNQKFTSIFEKGEIIGKNIKEIVNEVNMSYILNDEKKIFRHVKVKDRYYNIFVNIRDEKENVSNKNKIILLYFCDISEEIKAKKEKEENKDVVMLIEVDNLDDVLKSTEEEKALLLSAKIESIIKNYAQSLQAMITKYSSSKYVMMVQNKIINKEKEKNFDILDEIREISFGNKLTVTLSIGIGCAGETPMENHNFAISAKELALSRGGDQVVVKNKDKLQFYGGKTKEVAKRTKVRARVVAHALVDIMKESSNVFIMGHVNPDIDAIGAAMGLNSVAKSLGKESHIILDKINSGIETIIDKVKEKNLYNQTFITKEKCLDNYDKDSLLILVDVNSKSHLYDLEILNKMRQVVVIDHHRKSTDAVEATLINYIEPYASSTCELVTEMLQYMIESPKHNISSLVAEILLAGIYVDTKNFHFKTGVRTFEAAAYLRQLGVDIVDVKKMFASDLETYLKKASIMSFAEVENNISIAVCPPEIQDNVLAAQVADELLNITGIQASFVLVKIEDEVFISGRSFGDINVQLVLEMLGGGGHLTIAGTKLNNITINEAKEKLKNAIDKYLREGEE